MKAFSRYFDGVFTLFLAFVKAFLGTAILFIPNGYKSGGMAGLHPNRITVHCNPITVHCISRNSQENGFLGASGVISTLIHAISTLIHAILTLIPAILTLSSGLQAPRESFCSAVPWRPSVCISCWILRHL